MVTDDRGRLEVQVLGPVRAVADGAEVPIGGPRQQALLGALAVDAGRTVSVDALVDAVWDGSPPDAVDRTFKTYVAKLRRALGRVYGIDPSEVIRTETRGYRFDGTIATVDALRFEEEVARARDHLAGGEAAEAELLLRTALGRWRGDVLSGFSDQTWARPEVIRLTELRVVAEESLATAVLDAGRVAESVALTESLVAAHPERESAVRLLVLALYRTGRHGDALGVARTYRESLAEETGLDPSPQLAALETMVLEQDPRLDRPVGGRRLRGYVLHEVLATTAIGAVHRAEQSSIGRDVAVTVVGAEQADDPDVVRLFEARMQQVASVEHRRVVPLYDYWRHPGGAYLVTRLPGGGTLSQQLARGRVEPDAALRVLLQVAQGVAAAHERGVVHGALSTDAVVLDEQGHAFVWGFALLPPEDGPRGDLEALAALVADLVARVGVGAGEYEADGLAALVAATTAPDDTRVTSVAGFARSLEALLAPDAGTEVVEVTPPPTAPGPNPYRGLASFRETDAEVFFGRDELTRAIVTRLARQPFVAVFGPSGSGKSSVVRAGVLPRLRSDGAYVTAMVPGTAPLAELGVALSRIAAVELADVETSLLDAAHGLTGVLGDVLPSAEAEAVLVVDQFEELFTMAPEGERAAFLGVLRDALDHPLRRVRVIATVRADFLGRVLDDPVAGPLVHERSVLARPLTADELHEVVVGPAEVAGVAVEPALATAIVADATRFPGSLPMVQFALTEVFEAAEDATMELDAYRRIGGIEGVLGQRAEEVFAGLDEVGQRAAHQLFQRLVVPNDDGPPTRRRAPRAELAHVPDEVVEAFGRARLLRFDHDEESREPTVEVTHEALFRAWPRLVAWIEEGEDDLRLLGHLTVSADEWNERGRTDADLYRGNRLDAALAFAADRRDELSTEERDFLDASRARRARDAEADRRTVRRLRVLTAGLAVGLVLALVAGTLAFTGQQREAELRRDAEAAQATAESAQAAAEEAAANEADTAFRSQADAFAFAAPQTFDVDPDLGLLYAAEAYAATGTASTQQALLATLTREPRLVRVFEAPPGRCGARSPDGELLTVVGEADLGTGSAPAWIYDDERALVREFEVDAEVRCLVADATGQWLVSEGDGTILTVLDASTGEVVTRADLGGDRRTVFTLHPTRPELLVDNDSGVVTHRRLPSLEVIASHEHEGGHRHFSDTGRRILLPGEGVVRVIEEATTTELPHDGPLFGVTGLDGPGLLAMTTPDGLSLTDFDGGATRSVDLRGDPVPDVDLVSLRGGRVLGVPTSAGLEVIDVASGEPIGPPIDFDVSTPYYLSDGQDRVFITESDADVVLDPFQSTTFGALEVARATSLDAPAAAASDGSSYVVLDGTPSIHLLRSDGEVALPAPASIFNDTPTFAVGLLEDEGWLYLDLNTATLQRWQGEELLEQFDLSDRIPTGMATQGQLLDTTDEHVVAIVTDDRTLFGGHALVVDHTDGEVVGFFDPDPRLRGPRTFGHFVGDDRVMTYHDVGLVGLWTLTGEPAPGHVQVPNSGFSFAASPAGDRIAVGTLQGSILLLDAQGEVVDELAGDGYAYHLAFIGDGLLLARGYDGGTRLWDVDRQQLLGTLVLTEEQFVPLWQVTVDEGSGDLLHPSGDGLLRVSMTPEGWLAAACEITTRPLQPPEIERVAPGWDLIDPCDHRSTEAAGAMASDDP